MRIHAVVNPGAGKPKATLHTLNSVFKAAGVTWDATITHASGDAQRQARAAAESGADIILACGGDGTVMEVAQGVMGTSAVLAIAPGGTANLMAHELGVASNIAYAARVAADPGSGRVPVDLGRANGREYILRFGAGWGARQVAGATRELKDRWGTLAYLFGKITAWKASDVVDYTIEIDGVSHDTQAFTVSVVNAGNVGFGPLRLGRDISVSDGLLDLLLLRGKGPRAIGSIGGSIVASGQPGTEIEHVQGRHFRISATPPQPMQIDGELFGDTPVDIEVAPGALTAVIPATKSRGW